MNAINASAKDESGTAAVPPARTSAGHAAYLVSMLGGLLGAWYGIRVAAKPRMQLTVQR
jgi:hypothetical protein